MEMADYRVGALTEADARAMAGWSYSPPYDIYNGDPDEVAESVALFLDPANGYFAVRDRSSELAGFCCFGVEGRVPGGNYAEPALDIGVGMRPDLTGQGNGEAFTTAVLLFAAQEFGDRVLRATVAAFNRRSRRVCENHGFKEVERFVREGDPPREFVVLRRGNHKGRE